MRHAKLVARMREMRNACKSLVVEPEGSRLLVRHKGRWEDTIETYLKRKYEYVD
jgi:hypothetical protein